MAFWVSLHQWMNAEVFSLSDYSEHCFHEESLINFYKDMFLLLLGVYQEIELLGCLETLHFTLKLYSKVAAVPMYILNSKLHECSNFSRVLPALLLCDLL